VARRPGSPRPDPRPTPVGNSLRTAARLLAIGAFATSNDLIYAQFRLTLRLAALAAAIADLRAAQQHTAQATATRAAVGCLRLGQHTDTQHTDTRPPGRYAHAKAPGD
jgi:hypothetical protein